MIFGQPSDSLNEEGSCPAESNYIEVDDDHGIVSIKMDGLNNGFINRLGGGR